MQSDELVHINMWLLNGEAPSDGKTAEMVIKSFLFYANECTPPILGDWIVAGSCTLTMFAAISGNIFIEDGAVLTIAQDAELLIE